MKKILYLIVCLVVIQTKLYAAFATLEYNLPPPLEVIQRPILMFAAQN
ncbi:MAG: hypothetical protein IPK08_20320 [Bacteroidetes bacterium]|nr:hypothetical protein [Bacteroidota bacterium]